MDLLRGNVRSIYFRYLAAAFGSAMITSVYSIVDMAMVGQYQGPEGTAALAVVAPVWNIIYSLGLLMGIGGSVIFSMIKGRSGKADGEENEYFTAAVIGSVLLALIAWILLVVFEDGVLVFFGADEALLVLAREYLKPVLIVLPLFLFNQMLAAFLRNDGAPTLATAGVLAGGIFNIVGDYLFVFTFDMGIYGAGLATAIGSAVSFAVLITHFFSKRNTLALKYPSRLLCKLKEIAVTGFATFFVDAAMGILTILFNRQIMKYLGSDALSIYGPIVNVSTFVQCCAYSTGQAAQPIISMNYGAGRGDRIKEALKYSLYAAGFFSVFWTVLSLAVPNLYIYIFMKPTEVILSMAPAIIRTYSLSFLLLPLNIFSTYYFQALMKSRASFTVSVSRSLVSALLILLLPLLFPSSSVWYAMLVTEILVAIYALSLMRRYTNHLPGSAETS